MDFYIHKLIILKKKQLTIIFLLILRIYITKLLLCWFKPFSGSSSHDPCLWQGVISETEKRLWSVCVTLVRVQVTG